MTEYISYNRNSTQCALSFCTSTNTRTAADGRQLTFHSFPDDPVRCAIWVKNCNSKYLPNVGIENLKLKYKLCSLHFEDRMFNFQKNRLLSIAVPTLFKNKFTVITSVASQQVYETIIIDDDVPPALPIDVQKPCSEYVSLQTPNDLTAKSPQTLKLEKQLAEEVKSKKQIELLQNSVSLQTPNYLSAKSPQKHKLEKQLTEEVKLKKQTVLIQNSVSLQTPNYLSAKSPRKLKLKNQLAEEVKLKRQLEKTVIELKTQLEQTNSQENCLKLCEMYLPSTMYLLVKNHLSNKNKTPNGQRHLNEIIQFAHTIHHLGPKAYNFLQSHFTLPHTRTLRKKNVQNVDKNVEKNIQNDHKYSKI